MNDKQPPQNPDYGVRLTGDELAAHQQKHQSQQPSARLSSEYGPQGQQYSGFSEYGPQGGDQPVSHGQYPGYQPPGFQQPPYQQAPAGPDYGQPFGGPQLHPQMAQEPARPKTVNLSFWSILAAGVAYFLSQLVMASLPNRGYTSQDIAFMEDFLGPLMANGPFGSVEAYLNSPLMMAAIVGQAVVFVVAYFLVALGIRHGWRSMRIIATIFAALSLIVNLSLASTLVAVLSVTAIVLGILGVVYAWLPKSTEYFRQKAWQKAAKRVYPAAPSR